MGCYVEEAKGRGFHNAQGPAPDEINSGNQATFVGCFAEGAQPSRLVGFGGVFLGGASAFTDDTIAFVCTGNLSVHPFEIPNVANPSIKFMLGYKDPTNAIFGWKSAAEGGNFWLFRWLEDLKVWSTELGNNFPTTHRVSYQTAFEHARGEGFQGFPSVLIGPVEAPTKVATTIGVSTPAPPFPGAWEHGDLVYNSRPAPGDPVGWVYIPTEAQPWKGFGIIEP